MVQEFDKFALLDLVTIVWQKKICEVHHKLALRSQGSMHSERKHMYIHIKAHRHSHLKHAKHITFANIHKVWKSTVICAVLLPSAQLLTLAACPLLWPALSDGISVLCTHSPQTQALLQRASARRVYKVGGGGLPAESTRRYRARTDGGMRGGNTWNTTLKVSREAFYCMQEAFFCKMC